MVVRDARAGEFGVVGDLTVEAYGELASERYARVLRDAESRAREARLLVCVDEGGLLGTATFVAGCGPWHEIAGPDEAEFRMLAVDPEARGRGAGEALVEHMLALTAQLGRQRLVCSSASSMVMAHRLYERLGFARIPERDWSPMPDVALLVFAREVDEGDLPASPSP